MSSFRLSRNLLAIALCVAHSVTCLAVTPARVEVFDQPGGETYFAVNLTASEEIPRAVEHEVVVLFDTSAGQVAMYRESALAALDEMVQSLGAGTRVQLFAVDLEAIPLTNGFVKAESGEWKAAREALQQRAPEGATDMKVALSTAIAAFDRSSTAGRAAVYLGDGVSLMNILDAETLAPLLDALRASQIAVSSYAIGPRVDGTLLATIANQSGGNLVVAEKMVLADEDQGVTLERAEQENIRKARNSGRLLAESATGGVAWPRESDISKELGTVYPRQLPPLRSDRATILVGSTTGVLGESVEINVDAAVAGENRQMQWQATVQPSHPDNAYLAAVVENAAADDGITLPTVGEEGLAEVRRIFNDDVDQLTALAEQAVTTGNFQGAERLAQAVLRNDPNNPEAATVQRVIQNAPVVESVADASGDMKLVRVAQRAGGSAAAAGNEGDGVPGAFLEEHLQNQTVIAEMIQKEVEIALEQARNIMSSQPTRAIQDLKVELQSVRGAPELDAAVRAQLVDRLESAITAAQQRESRQEQLERLEQESLERVREQQDISRRIQDRQERIKQLMLRFDSLMDEHRFQAANDQGAVIEEIDPGGVTPRVANLASRMGGNYYESKVIRAARQRNYIAALYQTELSSIPFPDDPPIVYPPAEIWEELTARREKYKAVDLKGQGGAEQKIRRALDTETELSYIDTPLESVVSDLREQYKLPILLDETALEELGIPTDSTVTFEMQGITLRSALRLMLRNLELTYIIRDEVLLITTPEEAETELTVKVYPVADLVLPIQSNNFQGGLGGLGGGGGGGLGGGGGGGGGLGGGGGGFGGGGGGGGFGGGGGGFFSVPDDTTDAPADLTLTPAQTPAQPAEIAPIDVDPAADPVAFWDQYFQSHDIDPPQIRQATRDLMRAGKTSHTIALVRAALRHGHPQPWMYEALGIAMQVEGYDNSEIERALMSAVEFVDSPSQLLYVAQYLSRIGLDQRVLGLCQQVVKVQPLLYEAYLLGLRSAQRTDDLEGIQWATLGLLSQAWTADELEHKKIAMRVALATLEQLKQEGRTDEFKAFRRDLNSAMVRDCVVKVSWAGDADVDLLVEEPGGTVCSLRQPRTSSGGVMLGDTYARFDDLNADGFAETYVCPQGFDGQYRVRIRRVWGEVTAGKVTVDVYTDYRGRDQKHERREIDLDDKDALVLFEVDQGRRDVPIEAQQIAAAVQQQGELSRAILAQQINALSDPRVSSGEYTGPRLGPDGEPLLLGRGAVGYQPVIITLPQGTNLSVNGVISADRRYVRITALPFFSGIGDVQTFTFAGQAAAPVDEANDDAAADANVDAGADAADDANADAGVDAAADAG